MTRIITDYKYGVNHQVVEALRPIFGAGYSDKELAGRVHVSLLDYPEEVISFPAVFVSYQPVGKVRSAGVGHREYDDENNLTQYKHFFFDGLLQFTILARNALDRDLLSAALTNIIGFPPVQYKNFFDEMHDGAFVRIQMLHESITDGGNQGPTDVPWNGRNERIFSTTLSIPIFGEFYSGGLEGALIEIDTVNMYPWVEGLQPEPHGANDSAPWQPE